jgi:hypothetical protein
MNAALLMRLLAVISARAVGGDYSAELFAIHSIADHCFDEIAILALGSGNRSSEWRWFPVG